MNIRLLLTVIFSLGLSLTFLTGCNDSPDTSGADATDETAENAPDPLTDVSPDETADSGSEQMGSDASLISTNGVGKAKLGMTFAELKQELGAGTEYTVESPFIVDFDAIAVRQNGELQFYVLYFSGEAFEDDSIVQAVLTTTATFRTDANVGPGTPIAEAEAAYGNAILSYNLANESREYVRFENSPANNILFGTYGGGSVSDGYAGIYATPTAEYNETEEYAEGAAIQVVLVTCLAETCS
ncbi:MAG: hypothetical protein WBA57_23115 [Elainellaceae cyanobacterium]